MRLFISLATTTLVLCAPSLGHAAGAPSHGEDGVSAPIARVASGNDLQLRDAKGDPEKQVDYDASGIYDDTDILSASVRYDRKSAMFHGRVRFADLHKLRIPSDAPIYEHSMGVRFGSGRYDLGYIVSRTPWPRKDSAAVLIGDNADVPCRGDRFTVDERTDVIAFSVPRSCLSTMGAKTTVTISSVGYRAYMDSNPEPVYYDATRTSRALTLR